MDDRPTSDDTAPDRDGTTVQVKPPDPPDGADTEAARKRELNRLAKRRQREREKKAGGWFCRLLVTPVMTEALIAQSEDAGIPKDEAERASRSRKKVTADLNANNGEWAALYLAKRAKRSS